MRKTYFLISAALSVAMLLTACQNQAGSNAGGESGQEQGAEAGGASAASGENDTEEGNTNASGNLTGGNWGLNGNSVVGSNFISQSTQVTEIPIGSLGNIRLMDYDQVNVTLPADAANTEASDSDVDAYIKAQLQSELKTVTDRGAQKGDTVTVDYLGMIDGTSFSGNQGKDYPVVLGSGQMLADFEEALYGTKSGDKVKAKVTFPEDYTASLTNVQNNLAVIMVMRQIAEDQGLMDAEYMRQTLVSFLSEIYDTEISEENLEQVYGSGISQMELQAVVYEYVKDHINISYQKSESTAQ